MLAWRSRWLEESIPLGVSGLARRRERMSSVQAKAWKETKCPFGRTLREIVGGYRAMSCQILQGQKKVFILLRMSRAAREDI